MPTVAEPQPTRMRSSGLPLTMGCLARLDDDGRTLLDLEHDRLRTAELQERVARDVAGLLRRARQMVNAADREHLRAILGRGDMTHGLALTVTDRRSGPRWRSVSIFTFTPQ
jgi:hypothetical protein